MAPLFSLTSLCNEAVIQKLYNYITTYFWLFAILPDASISYMACSRHLTSSVGQSTSEEKMDATEPAQAFCTSLAEREGQRENS